MTTFTTCTCVGSHDGNCAFALSRHQCAAILEMAGYVPENWALKSWCSVELNCLREYVQDHVRLCDCVDDKGPEPDCKNCDGTGWRKRLECPLCHGKCSMNLLAKPCRACGGKVSA